MNGGREAVEHVLAAFDRLIDSDMPRRVMRPGILAGLRVLRKAISNITPVGTSGRKFKGKPIRPGGVKRSIGHSLKKQRGGMSLVGKVGINVGKKTRIGKGGDNAPHGHLLALGTGLRFRGRKLRRSRIFGNRIQRTAKKRGFTGRMPANAFVRIATAGAANAALVATNERILLDLQRDVERGKLTQRQVVNLTFDM